MILCEIMEDLLKQIERGLKGKVTPKERLATFVEILVLWHVTHQKEAYVSHREMRKVSQYRYQEYVDLRHGFSDILKDILQSGIDSGDFHISDISLTTVSILTMVVEIPNWYRNDGRVSSDYLAQWYYKSILKSIAA